MRRENSLFHVASDRHLSLPLCLLLSTSRKIGAAHAGVKTLDSEYFGLRMCEGFKSACGVYLPDLEQPRPPDVLPGMVKRRLVKR